MDRKEVYLPSNRGKIQVGSMYQAKIPELILKKDQKVHEIDKGLLVWRPTKAISNKTITSFVDLAKQQKNFTEEQALTLLYFHGNSIAKATHDLCHLLSATSKDLIPEEVEIFDRAVRCDGVNFRKIKEQLPNRSVRRLVEYYYNSYLKRVMRAAMNDITDLEFYNVTVHPRLALYY